MAIETLRGERVLIVGVGLSGASAARFLRRRGVAFDLVDDRGVPPELAALLDGDADAQGVGAEAIRGTVHERFDAALATRFDVLVLSPGVPRAHPAVQAALANGARVIGDVELFAGAVADEVSLVAVTGSNGKSTVVVWLAEVLRRVGADAAACGNVGRAVLDELDGSAGGMVVDGEAPVARTPEEGRSSPCLVLELSSYQLESTFSLAPHVATVLNVSADHLDRYASFEEYAAVKRRVHERASRLLVNADDPATAPSVSDGTIDAAAVARFTLAVLDTDDDAAPAAARFPETLWHRASRDGELWLCRDGEPLLPQSELGVPGEHNVANALAVLALIDALAERLPALGPDPAASGAVREALCAFRGLPHRTELVAEQHGVRWYNDSKGTNVDACAKAVAAMPGPVVLIAGGLAKGADFTPLRPLLAARAKAAILIGRDRERLHEALDGATELHRADSLEAAVARAAALGVASDAVLLSPACASFDMFADFEDRGRQFRRCVHELLGREVA